MSVSMLSEQTEWDDGDWMAWAVGLIEPLIDPGDRVAVAGRIRAQFASHTARATIVMAGVLADVADSLPADDRWRAADATTGFGTWRDGTDLIDVDTVRIREDLGLAALARPLDTDAVGLVVAAFQGFDAVTTVIGSLADPVGPFMRAASWLVWRRRAYLGDGEPLPLLSVSVWLRQAQRAAAGAPLEETPEHRQLREMARIVD